MPNDETEDEVPGRRIIRAAIEADHTRAITNKDESQLKRLTRKARRVLAKLRRGVNDGDDTIASALRTLLRRQDPNATVQGGGAADEPITEESQVWTLLEKHLERKLNTARHQPLVRQNQQVRDADIASDGARTAWIELFAEQEGYRHHDDPEVLESYIDDAFAILWEVLGDQLDDCVEDHVQRQIVELWILDYSQRAIADRLGIKHYAVIDAQKKILRLLRNAL